MRRFRYGALALGVTLTWSAGTALGADEPCPPDLGGGKTSQLVQVLRTGTWPPAPAWAWDCEHLTRHGDPVEWSTLLTEEADGSVRLGDTQATFRATWPASVGRDMRRHDERPVAALPARDMVLFGRPARGTVAVRDLASGELRRELGGKHPDGHQPEGAPLTFVDPEGRYVILSALFQSPEDAPPGPSPARTEVRSLPGGELVDSPLNANEWSNYRVSHDGRFVLVSDPDRVRLRLLATRPVPGEEPPARPAWREVASLEVPEARLDQLFPGALTLAVSPDGSRVATFGPVAADEDATPTKDQLVVRRSSDGSIVERRDFPHRPAAFTEVHVPDHGPVTVERYEGATTTKETR